MWSLIHSVLTELYTLFNLYSNIFSFTIAIHAPFWVAWQKCCPSTSPWEFPNRAINHVQHTLYQVLKHGDEPSDCESSCLCYYCYIEGLGLHAVYTARYVIRIKKRLRNRIKIERQESKSNRIARNMNIYTHKWNEIKLKLMIAITKSLTKDKIDKYILALKMYNI